jgi:peroxiredoxin
VPTPEEQLVAAGSLAAALAARAAASRTVPAREEFHAWLPTSGVASRALGPGDQFPDFVLPDARGQMVALADVLRAGPAVILFYRGGWCPFCSLALAAMQRAVPQITALGARVIAIGPDVGTTPAETARTRRLAFTVLSDPDNGLALSCGLMFRMPEPMQDFYRSIGIDLSQLHGNSTWTLPVPAGFVVDTTRMIRFAHVDPDYRRRMEPDDALAVLRRL